ncbi:MAG: hypothetical protein Q7R34_05100 [Dehalococcoidia bacterium]|nr:hypothetical protein [Dehalococcoidia bacterium]
MARHREGNPSNTTIKEKSLPKEKVPLPTGIKEIADLRSRMVSFRLYSDTIYLDTSMVIFYDLTRLKDPEYKKTFAEWITEVVHLFYHEHRHDFGIENLFQAKPQQQKYEKIAESASAGAPHDRITG